MEDVGAFFKLIWNTIIKYFFKEILEYLQEHHFDAGIAVLFVAFVVYFSREELYSQGRFEWRNLGLELSWTELGLGLLIECVILVLHYIAGFFPQGQLIWNTCCLLIVLVLCVFSVAKCIKAKLASQNERLSSEAGIANQGENAGPGPDQTSSTEAGNEVNLPTQNETPSPDNRSTIQKENERPSPGQSDASDTNNGVNLPTQNETPSPDNRSTIQKENERPSPGQSDDSDTNDGVNLPTGNKTSIPEDRSTSRKENEWHSPGQSGASDTIDGVMLPSQNETHKSEDRSASKKENKRQSPGQSNARSTNNGRNYQTILNLCITNLLRDLDFKAIYPYLVEKDLFDELTIRDILEQKTSTEQKQSLIDRLKQRGEATYAKFKECLFLSKQEHLKSLLEQKEAEVGFEME